MSSDRFSLQQVAAPGAVSAILVALAVPLAAGSAASGTVVDTVPEIVYNLSGCTGFAIWDSALFPATYCGITQDHPLISMTDERSRVVNVIKMPGTGTQSRHALVVPRSGWGAVPEVGGDSAFNLDVMLQADTVCERDSSAPVLQGDPVAGIVAGVHTGGDGPTNSHHQNGLRGSPTCV